MESINVKVAVRVRPFNQREIKLNTARCLAMDGNQTIITDPEKGTQQKFTFDHSYWSHDTSQKFATQDSVFEDLGVHVLEQAFKGFNTCLFAYGQTGAGKSYSMIGAPGDPGVVPRVCKEIFARINESSNSNTQYRVEVSYMEIYNEIVRDLFNPNSSKKTGLPVRENPITGPYVAGLESCVAHQFEDIERLMEEGNKMRTVAKTNMNDNSSRAHTIFQIVFTQKITTKTDKGEKVSELASRISLVDLAGSERAGKTGAAGVQLKEAGAINKSLSELGNIIEKLAKGEPAISYRNSKLTHLLKDSLGGNSKTIMIAALSPAADNYNETLSTLRYADRAKKIQNKAKINEDPNDAIIRELRGEIERLKNLMHGQPTMNEQVVNNEIVNTEEMKQLKEELLASQELINTLKRSDQEREQRTLETAKARKEAMIEAGVNIQVIPDDCPRLTNLNEDSQMSGVLVYPLGEKVTRIGRNKDTNDIPMSGMFIQPQHCVVYHDDLNVSIEPCENAKVYVNGTQIYTKTLLGQGDRVILGNHHIFKFIHPLLPALADDLLLDWDYAQREIEHAQGSIIEQGIRDREMEMEQNFTFRIDQLQEENEIERSRQVKRIKELEALNNNLKQELERAKLEIQTLKRQSSSIDNHHTTILTNKSKSLMDVVKNAFSDPLHDKLKQSQIQIKIANDMAREMDKHVRYESKLVMGLDDTDVQVQIKDKDTGRTVLRTIKQFTHQVVAMKQAYDDFKQGKNGELHKADDPFYEPELTLFGTSTLSLASVEPSSSHELAVSSNNHRIGTVVVDLETSESVGAQFSFAVTVKSVQTSDNWNKNVAVKYTLLGEHVSTGYANGDQVNLNHRHEFSIPKATPKAIKDLKSTILQLYVHAEHDKNGVIHNKERNDNVQLQRTEV